MSAEKVPQPRRTSLLLQHYSTGNVTVARLPCAPLNPTEGASFSSSSFPSSAFTTSPTALPCRNERLECTSSRTASRRGRCSPAESPPPPQKKKKENVEERVEALIPPQPCSSSALLPSVSLDRSCTLSANAMATHQSGPRPATGGEEREENKKREKERMKRPHGPVGMLETEADGVEKRTAGGEGKRGPAFLDPSQVQVVQQPWDASLLVEAGPGSGKTMTLVHRLLYLLRRPPPLASRRFESSPKEEEADIEERPLRPQEMVVLCFTRHAAHTLRMRFERVWRQQQEQATLFSSSRCALPSAAATTASSPPPQDDTSAAHGRPSGLRQACEASGPAVLPPPLPLRLPPLVHIQTLHSFGLACLRRFGVLDAETTVLESSKQYTIVKQLVEQHGQHDTGAEAVEELMQYIHKVKQSPKGWGAEGSASTVYDPRIAQCFALLPPACRSAASAARGGKSGSSSVWVSPQLSNMAYAPDQQVHHLFSEYQRILREEYHAVDVDDLQYMFYQLLKPLPSSSSGGGGGGPSPVTRVLRSEIRHLMVDEFQDLNEIQFEIVSQLAGANRTTTTSSSSSSSPLITEEEETTSSRGCTCVGDPLQSIYGWRGAVSMIFHKWEDRFPTSQGLSLPFNYRSTPPLVRLFNAVFPPTPVAASSSTTTTVPVGRVQVCSTSRPPLWVPPLFVCPMARPVLGESPLTTGTMREEAFPLPLLITCGGGSGEEGVGPSHGSVSPLSSLRLLSSAAAATVAMASGRPPPRCPANPPSSFAFTSFEVAHHAALRHVVEQLVQPQTSRFPTPPKNKTEEEEEEKSGHHHHHSSSSSSFSDPLPSGKRSRRRRGGSSLVYSDIGILCRTRQTVKKVVRVLRDEFHFPVQELRQLHGGGGGGGGGGGVEERRLRGGGNHNQRNRRPQRGGGGQKAEEDTDEEEEDHLSEVSLVWLADARSLIAYLRCCFHHPSNEDVREALCAGPLRYRLPVRQQKRFFLDLHATAMMPMRSAEPSSSSCPSFYTVLESGVFHSFDPEKFPKLRGSVTKSILKGCTKFIQCTTQARQELYSRGGGGGGGRVGLRCASPPSSSWQEDAVLPPPPHDEDSSGGGVEGRHSKRKRATETNDGGDPAELEEEVERCLWRLHHACQVVTTVVSMVMEEFGVGHPNRGGVRLPVPPSLMAREEEAAVLHREGEEEERREKPSTSPTPSPPLHQTKRKTKKKKHEEEVEVEERPHRLLRGRNPSAGAPPHEEAPLSGDEVRDWVSMPELWGRIREVVEKRMMDELVCAAAARHSSLLPTTSGSSVPTPPEVLRRMLEGFDDTLAEIEDGMHETEASGEEEEEDEEEESEEEEEEEEEKKCATSVLSSSSSVPSPPPPVAIGSSGGGGPPSRRKPKRKTKKKRKMGCITVGTAHSAKGMEWPAVIIPYCCEGEYPVSPHPEERRVLYVALTRAKRYLIVLTAASPPPLPPLQTSARPRERITSTPLSAAKEERGGGGGGVGSGRPSSSVYPLGGGSSSGGAHASALPRPSPYLTKEVRSHFDVRSWETMRQQYLEENGKW